MTRRSNRSTRRPGNSPCTFTPSATAATPNRPPTPSPPGATSSRRDRRRRGGPRTPLPLLPIIAVCAGIGLAYVSQTAQATQANYDQTSLIHQQQQLTLEDQQLGSRARRALGLGEDHRVGAAAGDGHRRDLGLCRGPGRSGRDPARHRAGRPLHPVRWLGARRVRLRAPRCLRRPSVRRRARGGPGAGEAPRNRDWAGRDWLAGAPVTGDRRAARARRALQPASGPDRAGSATLSRAAGSGNTSVTPYGRTAVATPPAAPGTAPPGNHRASLDGVGAPPTASRGWFVGEGPHVRGRAIWLMLCFASLAILLLGHLFQVQIGEHTALAAAAAREDNMSFVLAAHRGEILDSDGQVLVGTVATYSVYVDPALIPVTELDADAAEIAAVLRISESQVVQVLSEPNQYAFLADHVSQGVKDQLVALNSPQVPGLILTEEDEPVYEPSAVPGEFLRRQPARLRQRRWSGAVRRGGLLQLPPHRQERRGVGDQGQPGLRHLPQPGSQRARPGRRQPRAGPQLPGAVLGRAGDRGGGHQGQCSVRGDPGHEHPHRGDPSLGRLPQLQRHRLRLELPSATSPTSRSTASTSPGR